MSRRLFIGPEKSVRAVFNSSFIENKENRSIVARPSKTRYPVVIRMRTPFKKPFHSYYRSFMEKSVDFFEFCILINLFCRNVILKEKRLGI